MEGSRLRSLVRSAAGGVVERREARLCGDDRINRLDPKAAAQGPRPPAYAKGWGNQHGIAAIAATGVPHGQFFLGVIALLENEVDDASNRIAAVNGGGAIGEHLDPLDGREWNRVEIDVRSLDRRSCRGSAPVDQHQCAIRAEPSQVRGRDTERADAAGVVYCGGLRVSRVVLRQGTDKPLDAVDTHAFHVVYREHLHRRSWARVTQSGARHHDLIDWSEFRVGGWLLRVRRGCTRRFPLFPGILKLGQQDRLRPRVVNHRFWLGRGCVFLLYDNKVLRLEFVHQFGSVE